MNSEKKNLIDQDSSEQNKLIKCLEEMIITCAPEGYFKSQKPSLSQIWKWLKTILKEYMNLKKLSLETRDIDKEIIRVSL